MNPIYQQPGPPRTFLPTISSNDPETEYLNCFKNGLNGPEYLNETSSPAILPLTSSGTVHSIQKYQPQNSIDNPDYQQDFTPIFKTHANGHIPAAENAEYLGPDWGLSGYWQEIRDYFFPLRKGTDFLAQLSCTIHYYTCCVLSQVTLCAAFCLFACCQTCTTCLIPKISHYNQTTNNFFMMKVGCTVTHRWLSWSESCRTRYISS